jgi:RNA polymerase-binding transcription factor DksA
MSDTASETTELDLDAIETDLADVEVALARLEAGTYWSCEITGQPLPDELLAAHPTTRRLPAQ